jgi:Phytanoyl-CoA dioxygenase (PhyH)
MGKYLLYLAKMGFRHPVTFARGFSSWSRYVFVPGSTKRSSPAHPILPCADVEGAVQAFYRDGFVVLADALSPSEAEALKVVVKGKADEVLRSVEAGVLPPESGHGARRYSFGDYGHSPEWEHLARNEKILPIIKAIWKGHAFRAVAAGGDFVLPGGTWQPLHNDQAWRGAGELPPRVLTVNYYVSEVLPMNGPIRQVPGTALFPVPNQVVAKFEPEWMRQSLVTGKPGYAIIRDQRAWHGGTPNTSDEPRYMPNLEYVLRDVALSEVGGSAVLRQLNGGKWIAEFANA